MSNWSSVATLNIEHLRKHFFLNLFPIIIDTMNGICQTESGLIWEYINEAESDLLYEEIFEREIYLQHGITLHCNSVVIDVGANIGLFSLFVLNCCQIKDASGTQLQYQGKLIAIEPIPLNYEVLYRNITSLAPSAKLVKTAVGNTNSEDNSSSSMSTFVFFPDQPGESTRHFNETQIRRRALYEVALRSTIPEIQIAAADYFSNKRMIYEVEEMSIYSSDDERKYRWRGEKADDGNHEPIVQFLDNENNKDMSHFAEEEKATIKTFKCITRSLGSILNEHEDYVGNAIDLVKIDVEGDELHVLEGIGDKWWPKIRQLVVEVFDIENRLAAVVDILSSKGFTSVNVDQQDIEESTEGFISFVPVELKLFYVYATRTTKNFKH